MVDEQASGRSMIDDAALRAAVHNLFSEDPRKSDIAAAEIGDFVTTLEAHAVAIAGTLVMRAGVETDDVCYEQLLSTLLDICVRYPVPLAVLEPLRSIKPTHTWETEYIDDMFENAGYAADKVKEQELRLLAANPPPDYPRPEGA